MHLIKNDEYYFAFNKKEAMKVIELYKNKKICVIDFEAFQLHSWAKSSFNKITINDIPYTVCLNTLQYNQETCEFESFNEQVYQFCDDWKTQDQLLVKLEEMAIFIANYVKTNNIEIFLYMADYLEKQALNFFVQTFSDIAILKDYLILKGYDLYNFFFKESNFKILSYTHKPQHMIKTFMYKYGDEYENFEIGRDGMKHFGDIIKGKNSNILDFELVKKHSLIDLKKGTELFNYINALANWPDDQVINIDLLSKEK
ncbi:hypothetical protein SCHIN_v1c07670 [Spiroplasma chinense]|uniref:Uncharacterized protein n=1 Tax=Spiroplasma chinense TaxID=216932 RepID=A0A5B9Y783_9MOLU|nr:hypothetical protein [Spiroplasma chinense]QEH61962.1 hypothetical protein SCHIN_v1c07670 [Spiroplasma chinense]